MIGLSVVKRASKSRSDKPCGCSVDDCSFIRLTTLMTRTFRSGACFRRRSTAARVSSVGTSPQQTITTSGSPPWSLLAHSQMPMPAAQAVVGHAQKRVGVGRQVDADDFRFLVHQVVDETGV